MEEISWGQRVFGWSTPAFLKERNLQGEINIHNIFVGPVHSSAKSFAEYFLAAALTAYGVLYPFFLNRGLAAARWLDRKGLAAPPLYLFPFFGAAAILELGLFRFNEAEVAEVVIGFALAAMTIHYAFAPESPHGPPPAKEASARIARVLGGTVAIAVTLAVLSTLSFTTSEARRRSIENRIENGVEKFARRYARYERWDTAAALYGRLLKTDPRRPSVLRRLAQVHRQAGSMDGFNENLGRALEIDLERYRKNPDSPAVNRSLTRTYRMKDEEEKAEEHLHKAVTYARERVDDHALEQYRRAFELQRTSKKYRKAYLDAEAKIEERGPAEPL
jgi:tetratricopeptide (TPR) repeat protein